MPTIREYHELLVGRPLDLGRVSTVEGLQEVTIHAHQLQFDLSGHMCHEEQPLAIGRNLRLGDGRAGHFQDLDFVTGHDIVTLQGTGGWLRKSPFVYDVDDRRMRTKRHGRQRRGSGRSGRRTTGRNRGMKGMRLRRSTAAGTRVNVRRRCDKQAYKTNCYKQGQDARKASGGHRLSLLLYAFSSKRGGHSSHNVAFLIAAKIFCNSSGLLTTFGGSRRCCCGLCSLRLHSPQQHRREPPAARHQAPEELQSFYIFISGYLLLEC